jgi:Animal haem peroxidase
LLSRLGFFSPDRRGINGALLDLEYQRIELLRFNLFDNSGTFEASRRERTDKSARLSKSWAQLRLPREDPLYTAVGGDGAQQCSGEPIRFRTVNGICNDTINPLMGATGQPFARNVEFESTFPELALDPMTRDRHGNRIGLLKPDPQLISRKLFSRPQSASDKCNDGRGLPDHAREANCSYLKAPQLNLLAAFWIQFMTHDWFSHLEEGHNGSTLMPMGCQMHKEANMEALGCRPGDRIDKSLVRDDLAAPRFTLAGHSYMARAHRTTRNTVTA